MCDYRLMERLSIQQCKELIGQEEAEALKEEDVLRLRDMLYAVVDVIADAYSDLNNIDQSKFYPPNDLDDWLAGGGRPNGK